MGGKRVVCAHGLELMTLQTEAMVLNSLLCSLTSEKDSIEGRGVESWKKGGCMEGGRWIKGRRESEGGEQVLRAGHTLQGLKWSKRLP